YASANPPYGLRAGRAQMGAAMKAIVIHEFGNPSVLNLEDVPEPTLEAGEITIKVRAATVNQTLDVALRAGKYARRPPLPHVLGSDAAGEIAAVASDVKTLKVGDRVVCHPIIGRQSNGAPKLLGVEIGRASCRERV